MMRILDTNIVSFIFNDHTFAKLYRWHLEGVDWAVSFQTVGELREGAYKANWGSKRQRKLNEFLQGFTILHDDDAVIDDWARIRVERRQRPIGVADAWIAATALAYQLELVTHNPADFAGIAGLTVLSEVV